MRSATGCQLAVAVSALLAAMAGQAQESPACEAQLSAAQRARFTLATTGCDAAPVPRSAPLSVQSDALVASAGLPPPKLADLPARESAHLQLFARSGVVVAKLDTADPLPQPARPSAAAVRTASSNTKRAVQLAPEIDAVARRHDIDPLLLHAIAHVESRHNPGATSHAGARGVMQVMPATGQRFGVNSPQALHHAGTNLEVSATYLKTLQQRFGSNLSLVLAAYNAGEGAVERHGRRVPQYRETQDYVRQVLALYRSLTATATTTLAHSPD
jgi:soluble lytic murein transglycosylase-like protein